MKMIKLVILSFAIILQRVFGEMRVCYDASGNPTSDFPCDPVSNVSACCFSGYMCITSLYCALKGAGGSRIPSCTDRSFNDNACPFPYKFTLETQKYDFFSYAQNATMCDDGTVCMNPGNFSCCDQGNGKREVHYDNNAPIPTGVAQLSSYYANGDYTGIAGVYPTTQAASVNLSKTHVSGALPLTTATVVVPVSSSTTLPNWHSGQYRQGIRVGIGAGIGVGFGTMMIALILCLIWYRRKRIRATRDKTADGMTIKRSELESDEVREMDAWGPPKHNHHVQEMPAIVLPEMQTLTPTISGRNEVEKFF